MKHYGNALIPITLLTGKKLKYDPEESVAYFVVAEVKNIQKIMKMSYILDFLI
jgi:hypothetical protein